MRSPLGRHACFHVALDVLHHDDGIVNYDTDRKHQTEKRQVVDRDAERGEDSEGPDQRDGNRDHRDDGRPPGLQEDEHNPHDQQNGGEDGEDDFMY